MQAALDFKAECDAIAAILEPLSDKEFETETLFKGWKINDIIAHLHVWNIATELTLKDEAKWFAFLQTALSALNGGGHIGFQNDYLKGLGGRALFETWKETYPTLANDFAGTDPEKRLKWAGPDMSARSCIIARQMEHWSHAQAIYDVLGLERVNTDRIRNIAELGVMTYSWSFKVRGAETLRPKPFVRLKAPSGEVWEWNDLQEDNKVEGSATEFCQVVTQCRNIADTGLTLTSPIAKEWMTHAQCFAGGSETPPPQGSRHKA